MSDDSGQAFPSFEGIDRQSVPGMSLRDWFAGQVIGAIAADYIRIGREDAGADEFPAKAMADDAYQIADAMLKARGEY